VPCFACHRDIAEPGRTPVTAAKNQAAAAAPATLLMRIDERSCRDCHGSPHGIQFDGRKDKGACESCHGIDTFVPASRFDHARVKSFSLDGKHVRVPCLKCHPAVTAAGGKRMVLYRPISARCESCHADGNVLENRN
jgi:DnaJ-class molecular chaperone